MLSIVTHSDHATMACPDLDAQVTNKKRTPFCEQILLGTPQDGVLDRT